MTYLEIKMQKLERKNRLLTYAVIVLGIVVFSIFLMGATPSNKVQKELVAHSLRIVNDQGKNSAQIAATSDGFVGIYFHDLKGELRFGVQMTPSGKASIDFFGNNRTRLEIGVLDGSKGEEYSINLKDRDGNNIWQVPVSNPY